MSLSKKAPKNSFVRIYYEKLSQIFWASGDFLFHSHAMNKLFEKTQKSSKEIATADLQNLASSALLATVCVPQYEVLKP